MKIIKLRKKIDKLNKKIVKNLEKRIEIVSQITEIKKQNNIKIEDKVRKVLSNLPNNKLIQNYTFIDI